MFGGKDSPTHPANWVDKTCLTYLASKITIVKVKKWRKRERERERGTKEKEIDQKMENLKYLLVIKIFT